MGVSQLYPKFDKSFRVCVYCVSQADAVIAHVTDVVGGTRKTSAKPVSSHAVYRDTSYLFT